MDPFLKELVAIPSVCGDIPAAVEIIDYVEAKLLGRNMRVTRFVKNKFPSLVATTQQTKTPKVMLYAHLDVVAAPSNAFTLRLESGTYRGRGVLDMKGAAAAYLHVIQDMQHVLEAYDIGVMFTTDEEYYGTHGAGMLAEKGYLGDVFVIPDSAFGTNWQIEVFAKGCWFAKVTALGISTHGSRPWEGESANVKLIQALNAIAHLFDDAQKPDTATLNIGIIEGGKSINQIPAAASATLDIRYCDMATLYRLRTQILKICDTHDVTLKTTRKWSRPIGQDISHPLVASFSKHITLQTGVTPKPFKACGTTDARFFSERGIPCVLMSPPGVTHIPTTNGLMQKGMPSSSLFCGSTWRKTQKYRRKLPNFRSPIR